MKWCREFSEGRTDVQDKQRSGRPSLISYNFLQETEGEIRANRCVTITELHHIIPKVSRTTIVEAVTEKLGYRKLCACWVPKMLMDDHKTKRMGSALKFLTRYAQEGDEFLDSIVTGDETMLPAFGRQHRGGCITPQAVTHSLVLLKMGKIISRNMLS